MLLAPADDKFLGDPAQHHQPVPLAVGVGCAFESADRVFGDETITVNAHETPAKLLLEPGQRLLEQKLALRGAHRDIF